MPRSLALRSMRVWDGASFRPATVMVRDGVIEALADHGVQVSDRPLRDVGSAVVMPGIVDTHIHINDPGRTEWEGFGSATRAAALGGISTLVDMPLNSIPPTTTREALQRKVSVAKNEVWVDVGFWGGVVPGNGGELLAMLDDGVLGFKCFMIDSGVPEFPPAERRDIHESLSLLRGTGAPLLAHAELAGPIEAAAARLTGADFRRYASFLASRPPEAEDQAVRLLAELCAATGGAVHVVHQASSGSLAILEAAKNDGHPISAETCPHYLHFAAEDIPDGATQFKCVPPIREADNREALWEGLRRGVLDCVVSDHSPCTPSLKRQEEGDFATAWGGISSVQLTLPVMWTNLRKRGLGMEHLPRWMSERPAALAGLGAKGSLAPGKHADIVVWDPDATLQVNGAQLAHRHHLTPYESQALVGRVLSTYVRGQLVCDQGTIAGERAGSLLLGRSP